MRIAVVHEWLDTYAGAEKVLEQILKIYPEADLFAVVDFLPEDRRGFILNKKATTTFIQNLPKAKSKFRKYLPLMPLAIEQIDLSDYDLVISNSHCVSKGAITGPNQLHISYVQSPMRYAWDLQRLYLKEMNLDKGIKGWIVKAILHYMRLWDVRSSHNVDCFLGNSSYIVRRIQKCYRREAQVIHPPVAVNDFTICAEKEDYYLTVSRIVPYKKIDLIVEAFSQMPDKKLIVIGEGSEFVKIKEKATSNVTLMGYQSFEVIRNKMQHAKAFVFAAEEDFGIVTLEAQACGTPVIAYGKGGALETIRGLDCEKPTGLFFEEQTVEAIVGAINRFEEVAECFKPENCRANAERFSEERFRLEFKAFVEEKCREYGML